MSRSTVAHPGPAYRIAPGQRGDGEAIVTILVTGGAGFIGANFVLDWLAQSAASPSSTSTRSPMPATSRTLRVALQGDAGHIFVHGDIGDRALVEAPAARATSRGPSSTSPPKATSTAASTARRRSSETNVVGTFSLLEAARAYWTRSDPTRARAVSLPARVHRRGLRLAGPDGSTLHREHRLRPNSPYAASKAASDHLVRA